LNRYVAATVLPVSMFYSHSVTTIEIYFQIFCNDKQNNWFKLLPLAEFTYNNTFQESTKMSQFFTNYGFHPCFLVESASISSSSSYAALATEEFKFYPHNVYECLVQNVKHSQDWQVKYYDAKYKSVEFKPGDLVWLNLANITFFTYLSKKVNWKHLGPFKVIEWIELQVYKLELPSTMWHIYNVFRVLLLNLYKSTSIPLHSLPLTPPPLYVKDN